jgi:hypothetical protein
MGVLAEVDACSTVVEGEMACAVGEGKEAVTAILEQGGMAADDAKTEAVAIQRRGLWRKSSRTVDSSRSSTARSGCRSEK